MNSFQKALRNVQKSARSSLPHGGGSLILWRRFDGTMVEAFELGGGFLQVLFPRIHLGAVQTFLA